MLKSSIEVVREPDATTLPVNLTPAKTKSPTIKAKNKELLNNFINGICLSGYWELFK